MDLLQRFTELVKQRNYFSPQDHLLLAVSGGVDSVVLCELCHRAGFSFSVAHCNFQLRGEESDRDEKFVQSLAGKYNAPFYLEKFNTGQYAADHKISIQEAARELRYAWFDQLMSRKQQAAVSSGFEHAEGALPAPSRLLTAHHAGDNSETLLMNFFRGTGLHGLTGIPAVSGYIRRPLLEFSKDELMAYARQHHLGFVEDSSNLSSKYTRNFFRNELMPAIAGVYPQVMQNLQDNIHRFKEIESLYRLLLDGLKKKLGKKKGNEWHIPVKQIMAFRNRALLYEIIAPFGFQEKQVDELIKLAGSGTGKYILSPDGQYRIIRNRHWFIIGPVVSAEAKHIIIEKGDSEITYPGGTLRLKTSSNQQPATSNQQPASGNQQPATRNLSALLDLDEIHFPLLLRKWKTGDYFYPLGMLKKKKKLSRFFIDLKLPQTEKEKIWVIESDRRICWVLGYRIDERFKLTPNTKNVLTIEADQLPK